MSFILDALKKSEAERQRQAGPTLLELRITRPRRRYPLWAVLIGALLAINLAVLIFFMLRRPAAPGSPSPIASKINVPVAPAAPAPAARSPAASTAPAAPAMPVAASAAAAAPPPSSAAPPAATSMAAPATLPRQVAPLADATPPNPADDAPALPAGSASAPASSAPSSASTADFAALPSLGELGGSLPPMHLDLLSYSQLSSERYALINMHRVREGDTTAEGARVLAIMRDGVALDYRGQRFMLRSGASAP